MKKEKRAMTRGTPLRDCLPIKEDVGIFIPNSDYRKWIDIRTWGQV